LEDPDNSWLELEDDCEEGLIYHVNVVIEEEEELERRNTSTENVFGSNDNICPKEKDDIWKEEKVMYSPMARRKRKTSRDEDGREMRTHRRRVQRRKLSKNSDKDWEIRKKDAEIRDLLSSNSTKNKGGHPVRPIKSTRQLKVQINEGKGPTVDELLEGSLSEVDRERCDSEEQCEEEEEWEERLEEVRVLRMRD
jgi:hypothetical protein